MSQCAQRNSRRASIHAFRLPCDRGKNCGRACPKRLCSRIRHRVRAFADPVSHLGASGAGSAAERTGGTAERAGTAARASSVFRRVSSAAGDECNDQRKADDQQSQESSFHAYYLLCDPASAPRCVRRPPFCFCTYRIACPHSRYQCNQSALASSIAVSEAK